MLPPAPAAFIARSLLFLSLSLGLALPAVTGKASQRARYFCDSEALSYEEALGRLQWAWSCGINFCFDPHQPDRWQPDRALKDCGYPVFNEHTPTYFMIHEESGQAVCHMDGVHENFGDPQYSDAELDAWLSQLRVETFCRPVAGPR